MKANVVGLPTEHHQANTAAKYPRYFAVLALALIITMNVAYTQYLAQAFDYDPALGKPWHDRVYAPWSWYEWQRAFAYQHRLPFISGALFVGGSGVVLFFIGLVFTGFLGRRAAAVSALHGSAHWATEDEIRKTGLLPPKRRWWNRTRRKRSGVCVGGWADPKGRIHYLRHDGPEHVLCVGPTRSCKGVSLILPTLLSYNQSVVVFDMKAENYALTAGWRKRAGHKIIKFDPQDTEGLAAKYNFLDEVRLGTPFEVADAMNVVEMIIDPDGKGIQDHWDKTAKMFLVGVVLYTMYEEKKNDRAAGLPTVARRMTSQEGIEKLYVAMQENHMGPGGEIHEVIAGSAIDMLEKDERERGSVLSSAKTHFLLYADPIVSANISSSDFQIRDLMNHEKPVSLYIVVDPANLKRLTPLVRLLITQIVRTLAPRLTFKGGKAVKPYKHRLLLLLDEFASLGKMPIFESALAFIAGFGMKAYLFVQDFSQLSAAYGEHESITSNCLVKNAFAPNKMTTAKLFSEMTGTATVVKRVTSTSGKRFGFMLGQVTETLQETQRPLLTADEVMRLPGPIMDEHDRSKVRAPGDMLIFVAGSPPIYGRQTLFFLDPVFSARAELDAPPTADRLQRTV